MLDPLENIYLPGDGAGVTKLCDTPNPLFLKHREMMDLQDQAVPKE